MTESEINRQFARQLNSRVHRTPGGDARHEAFEDFREATELSRMIEAATSGTLQLTATELTAAREQLTALRAATEAAPKPTAPKAPPADREAVVQQRLGVLTARRNLTRNELAEADALRIEARKLEIKRRGY